MATGSRGKTESDKIKEVDCVNCGRTNPQKALICYWCGLDPRTGEPPYPALKTAALDVAGEMAVPVITLPPAIEVPPPMPLSELRVDMDSITVAGLTMPEVPAIEIAPPPGIPDPEDFVRVRRRRVRHRVVTRNAPTQPKTTRPALSGWQRLWVFVVGLALILLLGGVLVAVLGTAAFGTVFCLTGLLGIAVLLWGGLLLARIARQVAAGGDVAYERWEVLGRSLREVVPKTVRELPVNLPAQIGVLDLPIAYSELRYLDHRQGTPTTDLAVDLLMGAIASLVARDDVVLARRVYPIETRGVLASSGRREVNQPVIVRRRAHVGPGSLEDRIAQRLRTNRPMTVEELMDSLFGAEKRAAASRLINWMDDALSEVPPDLEAIDSPDAALAEFQKYRKALQRADPELYRLVEADIRRGLGSVAQRSVPASLLDLARYVQNNAKE